MFGIVVVERLLDYSCSPPLLVDSKCNIISRSLSHSVFDAVPDCSCAFPPDLKVIITDADVDMTNAVAEHLPKTVHLHCLWHMMKNVNKKCQGALGQKTSTLQKLLYACALQTM